MKLVAAKCPNCNANLDVNPKSEATKCNYCKSAILVDDAINKYKIELSGKVTISNLPEVEDYLKNADRKFKNSNYEEAYNYYRKVIEIEPEHYYANLKFAICKTLLNNYIDFPLDFLFNCFNDTLKLLKQNNQYEENIEKYVTEVLFAVNESLSATMKYFNTYTINLYDLENIINKLYSILKIYELLLDHSNNKNDIIEQIISVINILLKDKEYKSGTSNDGYNFVKLYKPNKKEKISLTTKLNYYNNILNPELNENEKNDLNETNDNTIIEFDKLMKKSKDFIDNLKTKNDKIISDTQKNIKNYLSKNNVENKNLLAFIKKIIRFTFVCIVDLFLISFISVGLSDGLFLTALVSFILALLISSKKVSEKIFDENKKRKTIVVTILVILLFVFIGCGI